jgi:hypothetical protein
MNRLISLCIKELTVWKPTYWGIMLEISSKLFKKLIFWSGPKYEIKLGVAFPT